MGVPAGKRIGHTYASYLEIAEQSEERLYFWDGEIYAMAGASFEHDTIETNLGGLLFRALEGRPCRPRTSNARLRALHSERSVYADGIIHCGPPSPHPDDRVAMTNPTVIFEVLSPSTAAFDRGDKFAYYREFPSVREVVFIAQYQVRVEIYTRQPSGDWLWMTRGAGQAMTLPSAQIEVPVDALYADTPLAT